MSLHGRPVPGAVLPRTSEGLVQEFTLVPVPNALQECSAPLSARLASPLGLGAFREVVFLVPLLITLWRIADF